MPTKRQSRSKRAGLSFAVSRVHRQMRRVSTKQLLGKASPVYLAAVLEYLTAEVLELAGNAARDNKRARINPRHIMMAVSNDTELELLLKGVTIPSGGIMPHIDPSLVPTKHKVATPVVSATKVPKSKPKLKPIEPPLFTSSSSSSSSTKKKKGPVGPINILSQK